MADYYPLIARAVAGLEKNTGDGRRQLYERARTALVAQLRGVSPALSESDVTRERLALEESIRKVEAESARQTWVEPARPEPPHRVRAPEMPRWEEPLPGSERRPPRDDVSPRRMPPPRYHGSAQANGAAPGGMFGNERYVDPVFDQPLSDGQPAATTRHPLRGRPSGERRSLLDAGLKNFRNVVSETDEFGEAHPAKTVRDDYADAESHRYDDQPEVEDGYLNDALLDVPAPRLLEPSVEDETQTAPRPYMPPPMPSEELERVPRRSLRDYIKIVVVLMVIAGFGGAAMLLWPMASQIYHSVRGPSATDSSTGTASNTTPSGRTKIIDRYEPGATQQPQQPAQQQASLPTGAPTGAAVAQRVVLYEEDPNDPAGKRYVGSAIWRTETISPGPGLPPELAIRADVEIPERQISMTWSLRRNTDPNLPATHTVEIVFKLPPDFQGGGVSNVPGILMKAAEQTRGVPLAGLAVKVTNGFFLIGLSSVEADRERNVALLKERAWFDIPVVYNNNRRAILALEKGTPGEKAFAEAFRTWKQ